MLKTAFRYFEAVVQYGSIRAAADALLINQSAISRQIQALESEFGIILLDRHARGVKLTEAGEILFSNVRDITFRAERVRSEIDALQGLKRGHIRMHTVETLVHHLVPQVLARFHAQFPGISYEVMVSSSDLIASAVRNGNTDIGIAFSAPAMPEVKVVFSTRERISAIMRADHPLARDRQLSVMDLAAWPIGIAPVQTGTRQLFETACRSRNVRISPLLETNSVELLHRFALINDGVAITSRLALLDDIRSKKLVAKPLKEEVMNTGYFEVLTLAERKLSIASERFLLMLRSEFDNLPGRP